MPKKSVNWKNLDKTRGETQKSIVKDRETCLLNL